MLEVKRSTVQDIAFMYVELRKFAKFYGTKRALFPAKEGEALKVIGRIVNDHLSFTSFNDGKPSGFIAGWFAHHPFNPEILLLNEAFWWVSEKYRDTKAGSALLDAYVEWGRKNADWTTMSLETESPVSSSVLVKRGFKPKEISFIMESE